VNVLGRDARLEGHWGGTVSTAQLAIVYDWLYPLLTDKEKQKSIRELIRLAETQECGYLPTRQGSVTSRQVFFDSPWNVPKHW